MLLPDKLLPMISTFKASAIATQNPFRLVGTLPLMRLERTFPSHHFDPRTYYDNLNIVGSFTAAFPIVQDLTVLDQMYTTLVGFEQKATSDLSRETSLIPESLNQAFAKAKAAYEETKSTLSSLQTHRGDAAAGGNSRIPSDELSVRASVARYGDMIDTSSLDEFKGSFTTHYKIASVKLHPDKNQGANEEKLATNKTKLEALQRFKAWVDELTAAEFAKSPK